MIPKRLLSKIEALLVAVAFAEEGEAETARQIVAEAEAGSEDAGDHEESGRMLRPGRHAPLAKGT
jgi:hypothetical protein